MGVSLRVVSILKCCASAMFSHAALAAASRKAAVVPQQTVGLGLGGPGRPEPFIVEDELEENPVKNSHPTSQMGNQIFPLSTLSKPYPPNKQTK